MKLLKMQLKLLHLGICFRDGLNYMMKAKGNFNFYFSWLVN